MNTSTEDGPALICIPDITGFTRFMAETNLEFSKKIIPPLLRNLVSSNVLNLKVGEVEGDAILFYRYGALPSFKELIDQCKNFYIKFTEQLESLKIQFPDDFAKYISANKLALKIVVHAAEMTSTYIEGLIKLIGEDLVVVHKLLKNSVEPPEYILFTEKLLSNYTEIEISETLNWHTLNKSEDTYDYIGSIKYRFISLEPLLKDMQNNSEKNVKPGAGDEKKNQ
jgi:hypothetical protein